MEKVCRCCVICWIFTRHVAAFAGAGPTYGNNQSDPVPYQVRTNLSTGITSTSVRFVQILLSVGGQSPSSSTPLFFSYLPPAVTGATPNAIPTRGGISVNVSGSNFGISLNPAVVLSTPLGDLPCVSTTRYSHFLIGCITPPGIGRVTSVSPDIYICVSTMTYPR
jgi:hypothetical protein